MKISRPWDVGLIVPEYDYAAVFPDQGDPGADRMLRGYIEARYALADRDEKQWEAG